MANIKLTKDFKLEVGEHGDAKVTLDGEVITRVVSFYINKDSDEQNLTIELWRQDDRGDLDIMNVIVGP